MNRWVVVSGGGGLGGFSAGFLAAAWEGGQRWTGLAGTSVGAVNVAIPPDEIEGWWTDIKGRGDIYSNPWSSVAALLTRRRTLSIYKTGGLENLLERAIAGGRAAAWHRSAEFRFTAADLARRQAVIFSATSLYPVTRGNPEGRIMEGAKVDVRPLLASAALPGLFPPVQVGGRQLFDGGLAGNAAIAVAMDSDAEEIVVVLHRRRTRERVQEIANVRDVLSESIGMMLDEITTRDVAMMRRIDGLLDAAEDRGWDIAGTALERWRRLETAVVVEPDKDLPGGTAEFDPVAIREAIAAGREAFARL